MEKEEDEEAEKEEEEDEGALQVDCLHARQHCRLTICIELVELTNSISIR